MAKLRWDHNPTEDELRDALKNVQAWPGSKKTLGNDYLEYVICIRNSEGKQPNVKNFWSPYVMVDGRIKMFCDAHIEAGKIYTEEFIPVVGNAPEVDNFSRFLTVGIKITSELFGTREDYATANCSKVGTGFDPDSTRPFENAATSARGRVIGAFACGLIPSQGVASAEEVLNAIASAAPQGTTVEPKKKTTPPNPIKLTDEDYKTINNDEAISVGSEDIVSVAKSVMEESPTTSTTNIEDKKKKENFEKAVKKSGVSAEELVAEHIKKNPNLSTNWQEWKTVEVLKLITTAREIERKNKSDS